MDCFLKEFGFERVNPIKYRQNTRYYIKDYESVGMLVGVVQQAFFKFQTHTPCVGHFPLLIAKTLKNRKTREIVYQCYLTNGQDRDAVSRELTSYELKSCLLKWEEAIKTNKP